MESTFLEIHDTAEPSSSDPVSTFGFENPLVVKNPVVAEKPSGDGSFDIWRDSALHFLLYLASFLSVTFMVSGLGIILYQMIDKAFPEVSILNAYLDMFSESSIKFGLSFIVIATPVYFVLSFLIAKLLFQGKIARDSKVRRWTTFIMLYFTFATILGDLISLVFNWFGGDMSARFFLKTIVVLVLAGCVSGYYLWNISRASFEGIQIPANRIFGSVLLGVVVVVFASSFFIVDSPALTRDKKTDTTTTSTLSGLVVRIEAAYAKSSTLPTSLSELSGLNSYNSVIQDAKITYKTSGDASYQICADFKSSNLLDSGNPQSSALGYASLTMGSDTAADWKHDKGNKCFDKTVTKTIKPNGSVSSFNRSDSVPTLSASPLPSQQSQVSQLSQVSGQQSEAQAALSKGTQMYTFHVAYLDILPMVGRVCRSGGGTLTSGNAGDPTCVGGSKTGVNWPKISECGPNPEDTKWTVFEGGNDKWTITLTCKNFDKCDGPNNAICSKDGCKYGGSCQ